LNSTLSVRTHVSLGHGIASPQYWSPDDKKILFIGVPEGMLVEKHEVYVVDIANDTVLNISNDSNAMDTSAIWQPRGH
jgi:Tol biopolymer transport system component